MSRPVRNDSRLPSSVIQSSSSEHVAVGQFGKNYPFGSSFALETVTVKSLFNNGDAVNELANHAGLTLGYPGGLNKYAFTPLDTENIQITPSDDLPFNSIATICKYVPTELDSSYNTSSSDNVTVRNDLSFNTTSFVDASSSAYMDATVRITFEDQYLSNEGNLFQDSSNTWDATFDTTSNYVPTRNVNAQNAHTDSSVGISAQDYSSWNNQGTKGPFYIEGDISVDSYGQPSSTPFTDASHNLSNYTDYTLDVVTDNTITPVFGRYALSITTQAAYQVKDPSNVILDASDVVVSILKTVLTNNIPTEAVSNLPSVVGDSNSTNPLLDFVPSGTTLQPGFNLRITSSEHGSSIDLIDNQNINPFSIDTTDMSFSQTNMLNLQNAVGTQDILNTNEYTDNYVEIINGSLDLSGVNASNSSLSLGTDAEYLTIGESDNGYVTFPSVNVISGDGGETAYPRASKTSSTDSIHFNQLVVRYESGDDSHTEIGIIDASLNIATDVEYRIETLLTNTTTSNTDYSNLTGYIGLSNESIALVTQSNNTIEPSAITYNNTNTNYPEDLYVIDFTCAKNWMENTLYNSSNSVTLDGATFNASGTNTNVSTSIFRDLRIQLTSKAVADLTSITGGWVLSSIGGSAYLTTTNEFESCLKTSDIQSLLGGATNLGSLYITYGPAEGTSCSASKLVQFNDKLTFSYNGNSSVTYNDELTVAENSSSDVAITINQSDYEGIPTGCVLNKRAQTKVFTVTTPFRIGAYNNLNITTPSITKTITYYTLTKDDVELPRRLLSSVTEGGSSLTATVNTYSVTTEYALTANDLKPYFINLQKTVDGSNWTDVSQNSTVYSSSITYNIGDIVSYNGNLFRSKADNNIGFLPDLYTAQWEVYPQYGSADMWYGNSTVINSEIGNFTFDFSMPLQTYILDTIEIYGDLSLQQGTDTFTVAGKSFTAQEVLDNEFNSFNFATASIPTGYGTDLTLDAPTYAITGLGNTAPGTSTLSSSGYSFEYSNNLLLNLRVVVVKSTIFSVTRTMDTVVRVTTAIITNDILPVDTGIYTDGGLNDVNMGDYAVWSLNNDYASVKLYNGFEPGLQEISLGQTVNGDYLDPSNTILKSRGVTFNFNRGYSVGTTTITRNATRVIFDIAGYSLGAYSTNYYIYYNQVGNPFGGLQTTDLLSMYDASVTSNQYWDLQLTSYGSYTIEYKSATSSGVITSSVPAYYNQIWSGITKSIVNNTLNTINLDYTLSYLESGINVYRISDYTNTSTSISDYTLIPPYLTETNLKDISHDNIIGNVLNLHLNSSASMNDLIVFFSICPPFISFSAINPSNVSDIPFTPNSEDYETYYRPVNYDGSGNNGIYNPFSGSNINNITFYDSRNKPYLRFTNYLNYPNFNQNIVYQAGDIIKYNNVYYIRSNESLGLYNEWPDTTSWSVYVPTTTTYNMLIDNYNFKVEMKQGLEDISSNYIEFYNSLIQQDTDNSTYSIGALNTDGTFRVELNQLFLLSQFQNFSTIDPSFNYDLYNLKMTIGRAFINNDTVILLEFVAGEAVSFDTYVIDDVTAVGGTMSVTVGKYTTDGNFAIGHLQALLYNGLNMGYNSKQTKVYSKALPTSLPATKVERGSFIRSIVENVGNTSQITWSSTENVTGNVVQLLPLNTNALIDIISAYSVSPNIPNKVVLMDLLDQLETLDKSGNKTSRITYNGTFIAPSVSLTAGNTLRPFF